MLGRRGRRVEPGPTLSRQSAPKVPHGPRSSRFFSAEPFVDPFAIHSPSRGLCRALRRALRRDLLRRAAHRALRARSRHIRSRSRRLRTAFVTLHLCRAQRGFRFFRLAGEAGHACDPARIRTVSGRRRRLPQQLDRAGAIARVLLRPIPRLRGVSSIISSFDGFAENENPPIVISAPQNPQIRRVFRLITKGSAGKGVAPTANFIPE